MPLADYLSQRVWQPIGAESDASWVIDAWGQEHAYDFFNAVLRDYARFGRLLAHDGWWEGRQIIPREWMLDATTAAPADSYLTPGGLSPGMPLGYGYLVWTLPGPKRMFALVGIFGQMIFVDPASKLVMVQTSVRTEPFGYVSEAMALWNSLIETVGRGLP
jgi:CubicO group peptidase (beta-lactamase class C family)